MEFFSSMLDLHRAFVFGSLLLFLIRGMGSVLGAAWPMDDRLRVLGGGIDFMITFIGLSLWGLLQISPFVYTWLLAKFLWLALFILFATLTLKGVKSLEAKFACFVAALGSFAAMLAVSFTRSPFMGLA